MFPHEIFIVIVVIALLLILVVPVILLASFFEMIGIPESVSDTLAFVVYLLLLVIIVIKAYLKFQDIVAKRSLQLKQLAEHLIVQHIAVLRLKRSQSIIVDAYGVKDERRWISEKNYFIERVIRLPVQEIGLSLNDQLLKYFYAQIDFYVDRFESSAENSTSQLLKSVDGITPEAYEHFCAELLNNADWQARVTKASGDQGADIVAEKNGKRGVFQCKKYTKPIGNKAVQEVIAAKNYYEAHFAVVVSNASFTNAALMLAQKSEVILMHHSDLERMDEILQNRNLKH